MYTGKIYESMKKVEAAREANTVQVRGLLKRKVHVERCVGELRERESRLWEV